ncbi:MAG: hypothetical protein BGO97_14860 [Micrococcales bacterium 70-64]|nr:N-acetyltransferase [Leifsonia sp.]ODU65190.1 MAG: hypothetical protein ABT06_14860 [Leifsonia sp. SCN 70-46]OJX86882.1 MAG: hypothetical protein BGO97_14860 [Micrococcales bacterium 70-64]
MFGDASRAVPAELVADEFRLRPITADDAALDHAAIMETREELRSWEQSTWPEDGFTVDDNRADLAGMQERHDADRAYSFTVLDPTGSECWGCVYVFAISAAFLERSHVRALGPRAWEDVDAVVYFWTRASRTAVGMDARLLAELRAWFAQTWRLERTVYVTNEQYAHQVALLAATDLELQFELREPDKPGTYLVYGAG